MATTENSSFFIWWQQTPLATAPNKNWIGKSLSLTFSFSPGTVDTLLCTSGTQRSLILRAQQLPYKSVCVSVCIQMFQIPVSRSILLFFIFQRILLLFRSLISHFSLWSWCLGVGLCESLQISIPTSISHPKSSHSLSLSDPSIHSPFLCPFALTLSAPPCIYYTRECSRLAIW